MCSKSIELQRVLFCALKKILAVLNKVRCVLSVDCSRFWECEPTSGHCLNECSAMDESGKLLYFNPTVGKKYQFWDKKKRVYLQTKRLKLKLFNTFA